MTDPQPPIIYFGNDWFAENRTSSHHVARQLSKNHRVYYIECPGMRPPTSSGRDLRRAFVKLWRFVRGATMRDGDVTVLTLAQFPFHRYAFVRWINRTLSRLVLRLCMWRDGIRCPILWFIAPHVGHLCGHLGEALSVYYCVDDFAAFPDVDVDSMQQMDDDLTRRVDIVFVSSETLLAHKSSLNAHTFHSPHGVDVEHFAAANRDDEPIPDEIAALPKPVVGFFGLIASWIDLDLIAELANARPQYSFVMIGRVAVPEGDLPQLPNLHFFGRRSYDVLPRYGRGFDCCLIPYRLTQQVLHANPLKLREYLAMGKPVVSVSTPEIDQFADVVAVTRSTAEFLEKLDLSVAESGNSTESARRMARVAPMSWQARVDNAWHKVQEMIDNRLSHTIRESSARKQSAEATPIAPESHAAR